MSINVMRSDQAMRLTASVLSKANDHRDQLHSFWEDMQGLIRLVRAWAAGEYRKLGWKSLAVIVGALVYFLDPLDAVPDFLPGIGFLDDASVIALVVSSLRNEVQSFIDWEAQRH